MKDLFVRSTLMIALTGLAVGMTPHVAAASREEPLQEYGAGVGARSSSHPADSFTVVIMNDPQFQLWDQFVNPVPQWFKKRCRWGFHEFDKWYPIYVAKWCSYDEWLVVESKTKAAAIRKIGKSNITHWPDTGDPITEPIAVIINGDLVHERDFVCNVPGVSWSMPKVWSDEAYRYVFVDYLRDIPVLAGLGNHDVDAKWGMGETMATNLFLALLQHPDREWVNFRLPDGAENLQYDLKPPDPQILVWHGSFAYSWDYGNYRFLQMNYDPNFDSGDKIPGFRLTPSWEWYKDRVDEATAEGKRIVVNQHADISRCSIPAKHAEILEGSNVVALFHGHEHGSAGYELGHLCELNNLGRAVLNNFGLRIPVFQGGHALFPGGDSHKLLLAEFDDRYLKVGVIDTWTDTWRPRRDPWGFDPPTFYSDPNYPEDKYLYEAGPFDAAPTVSIPAFATLAEGDEYAVHGTFADPDPDPGESYAVTVDYGDGTGIEELAYDSGEFDLNHRYADDGVFTVTVSVMSEYGNEGTCQATVTVTNVAPSVGAIGVQAPNPTSILPGAGEFHFSASFSDPGWLDAHTSEWDFGDGVIEPGAVTEENEYPDSTGTAEAYHAYATPGDYSVTVGVADDDGGVGTATATIVVQVPSAREALAALAEYIEDLPAASFSKPRENRRHALLRKLRAVDRMLIEENYRGAAMKLRRDLRGKADGLVDGHPRNDFIVDRQAQEDICSMIDDLCATLDWLSGVKGASYGPGQRRVPDPPGVHRRRR